jgi:hypothetical protein
LAEYVITHTERGECKCGQCFDRGERPDPTGHSVDVALFNVAIQNHPTLDEFATLIKTHRGEFADVDVFDGQEHSYIELGGWLGDQGVALRFMALGHMLEAFTLMTPRSILGADVDDALVQQMAGMGLVTVVARRS